VPGNEGSGMWMQRVTTTDVIFQTSARTAGIMGPCVSVLREVAKR